MYRANHGHILRQASKLADQTKLNPLLAEQHFGYNEIAAAYDLVSRGSKGKVVIES